MIGNSNLPAEQDISTFSFHNNSIRCILINGEPWFLAKDVCETLGYKNSRKAIGDHIFSEDLQKLTCDVTNRYVTSSKARNTQVMIWINESGLYSLILSSKQPSARDFKKWVTSEVLPAIRKYGRYDPDGTLTYGKERYQSQSIPLFLADDFFLRAKTTKDVKKIMNETFFFFMKAIFNGEVTDKSLAHTMIEMFNQLNLVAHKTTGTVRTQLTTMFVKELRQYIFKLEQDRYTASHEKDNLQEKLRKIEDTFKNLNNI